MILADSRQGPSAIIIICTRLESSRIPVKAIRKLAGVPVLDHIISRVKPHLPIVIACPEKNLGAFSDFASRHNIELFAGFPDSPLHRMSAVIEKWPHDYIVRITHDDPIIDGKTMMDMLHECADKKANYGYSPSIVEGAGIEIISAENLISAAKKRKEPTEFVSYFVKHDPVVKFQPRPNICKPYRLTLDYPEDIVVLETVLRAVGPGASTDVICQWLSEHEYISEINRLPLISFYTCARNADQWVEKTMASILRIGRKDIEYIFVDDGSTDDTLKIACRFAYDSRLKIIVNESNIGLASSSNIAVSKCKGRFVMRIDADDILSPGFETEFHAMEHEISQGAAVVFSAYQEIDTNGFLLRKYCDPRDRHHVGGALFEKRFLDEMRFRDGLKIGDGLELLRRMRSTDGKISYHDVPTWFYRRRPDSLSASMFPGSPSSITDEKMVGEKYVE